MGLLGQDDTVASFKVAGTLYGYSGTKLNLLGAAAYTLVDIQVDTSSSVHGFDRDLEQMVKNVIEACQSSPQKDTLLVRVSKFATKLTEIHGFKPLSELDVTSYDGQFTPQGATALYDASLNSVEALRKYGKNLVKNDYDVNGILIVITDGMDVCSSAGPVSVQKALTSIHVDESLESLRTILVGVNAGVGGHVDGYLNDYAKTAGFDQQINTQDASPGTFSKLADFVSKSISAQSLAINTGGPSQSLSF